eukprot:4781731-Prymnesium_polylepis.1
MSTQATHVKARATIILKQLRLPAESAVIRATAHATFARRRADGVVLPAHPRPARLISAPRAVYGWD